MTLTNAQSEPVGFGADEIALDRPTRAARLKWVLVVRDDVGAGRAVNAAACVASATGSAITRLLGPDAVESDGRTHPGLPWAGCSILGGTEEQLRAVRDRAGEAEGVWVADMPLAAQTTRVYAEYLDAVGRGEDLGLLAVSVVGPRNRIDRLTKGLALLP